MFLDKLKNTPKDKLLLFTTIIGIIIVILLYLLVFIPIEASFNDYGILDFEFVWTPERAEVILGAWGPSGRNKQTLAIYWDFLFIIGYVSIALSLNLLVSRRLNGTLQNFGILMSLLGTFSGLFDIIENINLLIMLDTPTSVSSTNALTASISATIKFGFLLGAINFFVMALIILLIKKLRKRKGLFFGFF
ncbi:MAG: hypothetical protein ACFE8L_14340 [Candidatus Hodarchaeota archaeon]